MKTTKGEKAPSKARITNTEDASLRASSVRTVTIHPRVSKEEDQIVEAIAKEANKPETTIWNECATDGLLIQLIKQGPNALGMYGGRWSAKELAQIVRRRFLNLLFDFQYQQGELPGLLSEYLTTLKTLAERQSPVLLPGTIPVQPYQPQQTPADPLIFNDPGPDAEAVSSSLGGMGFSFLGLQEATQP